MSTQIAPELVQTVFNRYEKKYLMTEPVYRELRKRLEPYMQVDMYGLTTILNLYFDTPDGLLVRRSNEMPEYKEKLRLRSYGVPKLGSTTYLEIKKKYEGLVNKRRVGMTLQEAYDYACQHDRRPETPSLTAHPATMARQWSFGRMEIENGIKEVMYNAKK